MLKQLSYLDLLINDKGCIYHLNLSSSEISDKIILVGDPGRVPQVSRYFDQIEIKEHNREIVTHTGFYSGVRFKVMSTGMGCDNIDIVLNELDALVNIDFKTRKRNSRLRKLDLMKLGITGALDESIQVGSFLLAKYALGLD